jgi:hypothetical protein
MSKEPLVEETETTTGDLDTYWSPEDVLADAIERIIKILESVRVEGVYGVVSLGMYDLMNDTDLIDVRSVVSKTNCLGLATFAEQCLREKLMGGIVAVSDGDEEIEV